MDSQPVKDIEAALRDMEALAEGSSSSSANTSKAAKEPVRASQSGESNRSMTTKAAKKAKKRVNPVSWLIRTLLLTLTVIALPFLLLIRLTLHLHVFESFNIWLALLIGISAATVLLVIYGAVIQHWMTGSWNITRRKIQLLLLIVFIYSGYSLMYLSGSNVKSEEVAHTYLSMHPTLRLATSTLVLIDQDLVVTDMGRAPEDYVKMGLPVLENSLHYKQESGFVEAVDIRTQGKPEWVNFLVRMYYRSMGFNTLRHVGTADHLHVSVPR